MALQATTLAPALRSVMSWTRREDWSPRRETRTEQDWEPVHGFEGERGRKLRLRVEEGKEGREELVSAHFPCEERSKKRGEKESVSLRRRREEEASLI